MNFTRECPNQNLDSSQAPVSKQVWDGHFNSKELQSGTHLCEIRQFRSILPPKRLNLEPELLTVPLGANTLKEVLMY